MYTKQMTELQDLVDTPAECEWLELKSWVDLTDKASPARAGIARHVAAIANYGGGYLVFGLNDDGTRCARRTDVRRLFGHDVIAGIIDRYLRPKFQCDVYFENVDGVEHAIVWIPSHRTTPVISKADGPQNYKGQPQGIRSGLVYIRTPKPESVPITTPEQWDKLIQRCVLARRDELIKMFSTIVSGGMIDGSKRNEIQEREELSEWHQGTQNAFQESAAKTELQLKFPIVENFVQFTYMIRSQEGRAILPEQALEIIEKVNAACRDMVRYGWSMFHLFTRPEISPHFNTDPAIDGGRTEFVQTNLNEGGLTDHVDFWRISLDGRASLIRNFHEDRFNQPADVPKDEKWFDPWLHVRDLTEIVRHARAYSEEFAEVEEICFQIEWKGLSSRTTATINAERYVSPCMCQTDRRIVVLCFTQAEMIGNLPAVVSSLYAPVHRLFDPRFNASPEWVSGLLPSFIVPGL